MKYIKIAILILIILIIMVVISIVCLIGSPISNHEYEEPELQEEKNDTNIVANTEITSFEIAKLYFEDYKYKALNKPEEAFSLIDEEYRKKKFENDIEQYKTYIQANLNRFQDANIVKCAFKKEGQFGVYVAMDSFDNYYKITENRN